MNKDEIIQALRVALDSACESIDDLTNCTHVMSESEIESHRCKIEGIDKLLSGTVKAMEEGQEINYEWI